MLIKTGNVNIKEYNFRSPSGRGGVNVDSVVEATCRRIMFSLWHCVETKQYNVRSVVGDTALDMRSIFYGNDEHAFWRDYDRWKAKQSKARAGEEG